MHVLNVIEWLHECTTGKVLGEWLPECPTGKDLIPVQCTEYIRVIPPSQERIILRTP